MRRFRAAAAAGRFQRAWRKLAEELPAFGRAGRWAVELGKERPRLAGGPLFGELLTELTQPGSPHRPAPRRPAKRAGAGAERPASPPPHGGEARARRAEKRMPPAGASAARELRTRAPGEQIAHWAAEEAGAWVASGPARERRAHGAAGSPPGVADAGSVAEHRRSLAARSSRPLSVGGRPPASTAGPVTRGADGRRGTRSAGAAGPAEPPPRPAGVAERAAEPSEAVPEIPAGPTAGQPSSLSPPDPCGSATNPWTTPVSGPRAPRSLLEEGTADATAPPPPGSGEATRRARQEPERDGRPRFPGPGEAPAPLAPELPRSSRDRPDVPGLDSPDGRPAPFAPIAPDPVFSLPSANPLGPFPSATGPARAAVEPPQGASFLPPEPFSSSSPDELSELAQKMERILVEEARRHGIDV